MNKIYKIIAIFVLGLSLSIGSYLLPSQLFARSPNTIDLLQKSIELYKSERYNEAIDLGNEILIKETEPLNRAFILSNLSLSYQKLGNWQEAEMVIDRSLDILNNLDISTKTHKEILAKALNTKGSLEWSKGDLVEAIDSWNKAATNYFKIGDIENRIKCQLNESRALQRLGFSSKAKEKLEQINIELENTSNSQLKIIGLRYLGNVLRQVGNLQESEKILKESLRLDRSSDTLLELGNTERALSDKFVISDRLDEADDYARQAILSYQKAFDVDNNIKAGLNELSLEISLGKWSDIESLIPQINLSLENLEFNRSDINTRLNFIRSISCLKEIQENNNVACVSKVRQNNLKKILEREKPELETPEWEQITATINTLIEKATDSKTKSYAIGELGKIYESQQNFSSAKNYTEQALLALEEIEAPEIKYLWEWQLGRIFKKQNNLPQAISAYSTAIENIELIRKDLLTVNKDNSNIRFSFRDNTEPIYRQFVDLLLTKDSNKKISQENLELAIQNIDNLQLAEVETFLNCDLTYTNANNYNLNNIDNIDPNAVLIYPIILEDRLEVIFKLPGQPIKHHTQIVDKTSLQQTIRKLKRAILRSYPERIISSSTIIYNWLLEPIEKDLQQNNHIKTLVFILDGELRNIPMGVLYDSKKQEYLIQKQYALALLPTFQAFDLQSRSNKLKVLGAGITQKLEIDNKSFLGLNVTEELNNIKNTISSSILLDSEFTQSNIKKQLDTGNFSIVHLATHGNFSSNPDDTYLVVYDSNSTKGSLLKAREFDTLLRQTNKKKSVELLVLSACETAQGDTRATLGLAGIAIKAGAFSTIATLWQVSDRSTIELMTQFYKELNVEGTTKAIALHKAQQSLFNNKSYQSPYYWSPYVFVGNWL